MPLFVNANRVLKCLKNIMCEAGHHTLGIRMRIGFSKGESGGKLTGLSTENSILGMVGAASYNKVDMVSLSLGD